MMNIKILNKALLVLIITLPALLVSGPAIPDIFISISGILFLLISIINKNYDFIKDKFVFILLIWSIYLIILSLTSEYILLSLESSLFYFRYIFFILVISYLCNNYEQFLKLIFVSLQITILFICFDAIFQFVYGYNVLGYRVENNSGSLLRISGLFGDELILGSFVSRLLPILVGLNFVVIGFNNKSLINLFLILIITSITILISGERSAVLYLIIFIFLTFLLIKSLRLFLIPIIFIYILSTLTLFNFYPKVKERVFGYTLSQTNLLTDDPKIFSIQHEVIFKTSLKIFKDNVIFGIGPKNFREICKGKEYQTLSEADHSINGCQTHSHNTYIQLLVETGIVGTSFVLFFLFYIIKNMIKIIKIKKEFHKNEYVLFHIFILINIFINLWPLVPTGSFFNNWLCIIYFFPIGFLLYSKSCLKKILY